MLKTQTRRVLAFALSLLLACAPLAEPAWAQAQEYPDLPTEDVADVEGRAADDSSPQAQDVDATPVEDEEQVGPIELAPVEDLAGEEETTDGQVLEVTSDAGDSMVADDGASDALTLDESEEAAADTIEVLSTDAAGVPEDGAVHPVAQAQDNPAELRSRVRLVGGTWQAWGQKGATLTLGDGSAALSGVALRLASSKTAGGIRYRVHVGNKGWLDWKSGPSGAGSAAQDIQAVRMELTGEVAQTHDLWYRVKTSGKGWMGWTKNGLLAGTEGLGRALTALQVRVLTKDATHPAMGKAYADAGLTGRAHVQSVGWRAAKHGYSVTLGTTGRGLRLESLTLDRPTNGDLTGSIVYQAHVQGIGWQKSVKNGKVAGTVGRGLRVEALRVKLTGGLAKRYDVWYRLHVQRVGWMGWTKNGESAGTEGMSLGVEAVQVALVAKGSEQPASKVKSDVSTAFLSVGGARYRSQVGGSWQGWRSGGATSGSTGRSLRVQAVRADGGLACRIKSADGGWSGWAKAGATARAANDKAEALKFKLVGTASSYMDVWYRAHVSGLGWLGWTKNGATAGSDGLGLRLEAFQVKILPKGSAAPGSTTLSRAFVVSGDSALDAILNTIYLRTGTSGVSSLRRAHDYLAGPTFRYIRQNVWPAGDWRVWSKEYAKEFWNNKGGNCYRYASIACWLAIGMGFDANVYCGQLNTTSAGLSPHGWVEVHYGGTTYVVDPELQQNLPIRDFFWNLYSTAPVIYYTPQGQELV